VKKSKKTPKSQTELNLISTFFSFLFLKKRCFFRDLWRISSFSRRVLAFSKKGRTWRRRRNGRADGVKHHPIDAKKNKNERRRNLSSRGSFRSAITAFGRPDSATLIRESDDAIAL